MLLNGKFSSLEVNEELGRIFSSPVFKNSRVLTDFLRFIVKESLEGREKELKEYTIATKVLAKGTDFNPQLDAIVRIHAGRLRRALHGYYSELGKNDPLEITIPKGSYVPVFALPDKISKVNGTILEKQEKSLKRLPCIAVLPFRNINHNNSTDFFTEGLSEQLSYELAQFQEISVIAYMSSRDVAAKHSDTHEIGDLLDCEYLLSGSFQSDGNNLQVWIQLISAESSRHIWSKSFERRYTAKDLFLIQKEIVENVLNQIAGLYGAIMRDVAKASPLQPTAELKVYDALFWYYHHEREFTQEVFQKARTAIELAVKLDPEYALAWAYLADMYMDGVAVGFKNNIANPLEEAMKCAHRAIEIDPLCQHAYWALTWINLFLHNRRECLQSIEKCLSLNPKAVTVMGSMGWALILAGEFERGVKLMEDSIKLNPYYPWWFNAGYSFYHYHRQDYQQALDWADKWNKPDIIWEPIIKAACLGKLELQDEAQEQLNRILVLQPDFLKDPNKFLGSFFLSKEFVNNLEDGLVKAGLAVA